MQYFLGYLAKEWISILALTISGFLLYRDYLRPFALSVNFGGRVTLARNVWSEDLKEACLGVDLRFSNAGATRGSVLDIALEVLRDGQSALFRSHVEKLDRELRFIADGTPPKLEPFLGFDLAKQNRAKQGSECTFPKQGSECTFLS